MRYCPSLPKPWPHMPLTLHTPQALMLQWARASGQLLPHRRYMVLSEHMAPPPPLQGRECCLSLCTLLVKPLKPLKPLPHQQPHTQLLAWLLWHRHYTAMLCLMMVTMATPRAAPMAAMAAPTQPTRLAHTA